MMRTMQSFTAAERAAVAQAELDMPELARLITFPDRTRSIRVKMENEPPTQREEAEIVRAIEQSLTDFFELPADMSGDNPGEKRKPAK